MNKATANERAIMLALSEAGCTVWRNETGKFWTGKVLHRDGDQVTLKGAKMIALGLCPGSSDIIGLTPNGRFLAIEAKAGTGRPTKEQRTFITAVKAAGGVAGAAWSPEQALSILNEEEQ